MLIKPTYTTLYRNKAPGIVQSNSRAGATLRANAAMVDTRTPRQVLWRQVFLQAKRNYAAIAASPITTWPASGMTDAQLWGIAWANCFNTEQQGVLIDGVDATPLWKPNASTEAFYTMCQANFASLQLGAATPGPLSTVYSQAPANGASVSSGADTVTVIASSGTGVTSGAPWVELQLSTTLTGPEFVDLIPSISPAPAIATWPNGQSGWLAFELYAGNPNTIILSIGPPITLPAGTYTLSLTLEGSASPAVLTLEFIITNGPAYPVPQLRWSLGITSAYATTTYDDTYTPTDISIGINFPSPPAPEELYTGPVSAGPIYGPNGGLPTTWGISASPCYKSAYTPPDPTSYKAIGYVQTNATWASGTGVAAAAELTGLKAMWETVFGTLPTQGNIDFNLVPIDTTTGASFGSITCTAKWENGTLRGADLTAWTGALFNIGFGANIGVTARASNGTSITYQAANDMPSGAIGQTCSVYYTTDPPEGDGPFTISAITPTSITVSSTTNPGSNSRAGMLTIPGPPTGTKATITLGTDQLEPGSPWTFLLAIAPVTVPNPGQPPPRAVYSGTVTLTNGWEKIPAGLALGGGLTKPTGVTVTFDPPTITIDPSHQQTQYAVVTVSATAAAPSICAIGELFAGDGIITQTERFLVNINNTAIPFAPPPSLEITPQNPSISPALTPGTPYTFTLYNMTGDDATIELSASATTPLITAAFTPSEVDLPALTTETVTALPFVLTLDMAYNNPSGLTFQVDETITGSLVGYALTAANCGSPSFDGGPWIITGNGANTITVAPQGSERSAPTNGQVTITNPNSATPSPAPSIAAFATGRAQVTLNLTTTEVQSYEGYILTITAACTAATLTATAELY